MLLTEQLLKNLKVDALVNTIKPHGAFCGNAYLKQVEKAAYLKKSPFRRFIRIFKILFFPLKSFHSNC